MHLLVLGLKAIDANEALRIGLVSRVVAPQELLPEAQRLAARIAANPPQVLRWTKQLLLQARTGTLDEALDAAGRLQGQAHHTEDHAEAVAAFFDKRTPCVYGQPVMSIDPTQSVLLEERPIPGVVLLRLNRPEVLNALNLTLRRALAEAFLRLDADPTVRVIVLAGGTKAFCAAP